MYKLAKLAVPFEVRAISEDEKGLVEGYASVFGAKDWYGSVFDKGCFLKSLSERKNIKVLWNHDAYAPIGRVIEAREDDYGLFVKYKLSLGTEHGNDIYELIKDGVIDSMSIGFNIRTEAIENDVWHIKEVDLWEVSPVTFAANNEAMITSFRSLDPRNQKRNKDNFDEITHLLGRISITAELQRMRLLASNSV